MLHDALQKTQICNHTKNTGLRQSGTHCTNRLIARIRVYNQLGDHRIIVNADFAALFNSGIDPDTCSGRTIILLQSRKSQTMQSADTW